MMMKNYFLHFVLTATISTFALALSAQNDSKINIQGTLQGVDGAPVPNGAQELIFRLYDQPTEGTPLWADTAMVEIAGGVYSYNLGSGNPLIPDHFSSPLYVGVVVDGEELTPRTELTSAPYTLRTSSAAYADTAAYALTATYYKAEVATKTRIIRGVVNANGTIAAGAGFTVSRIQIGTYNISFDEPFATTDDLVVLAIAFEDTVNRPNEPSKAQVIHDVFTTNAVQIRTFPGASNQTRVDFPFSFIIIGTKN
ncbi:MULTISPECIES: hypothetical protein [Phaeodactylibacter]|jgi:hypothetical protein|uniref:hypothetical protein n=1 Tax=Phaeodactylibacter TaxID=1564515 RepID=UPI0024A9F3E5|nr:MULTISPECIES: hypothetical protein [Phaeodactylibacter]MCI4647770.1 hypothetical protein [Phaeodactylibacter sp.]MCI5094115.1 hypothetical protein [Phaeodactylibacter sp.]